MATRKKLAKEVNGAARPARVPVRKAELDAAHCWLERTNPVSGLSIRTAQSIFDAARSGDTQRLHWLFHEIESSNPILFTCIERRQSAVAGFQLKVSALPSMDGSLADEQKDAVESFIAGIENLYHNPECDGWSHHCVPCADAGLIGIQRRRAIDYPALSIHIRHAVSERDWGRFLERYALPKPAVTMAPNATNEQRNDYLAAARAVENGQVSVWPNGTNITDFAGGSRGTDPFNSFIEHQEKLIVLLATGGTLTSLAQADTGSLAGGAQMKVWQEIVRRDAGVLAQAVKRSIVKPYLERTFGARPCAVDFALDFPEERSAQDAANVAATLRQAGWRVDQGELEKAVGFTLEREENAPGPQAFARAKANTPLQNARNALQNAPGETDAQGEGQTAPALLGAFSAGFEKAVAEAMAKAMVEELEKDRQDEAE